MTVFEVPSPMPTMVVPLPLPTRASTGPFLIGASPNPPPVVIATTPNPPPVYIPTPVVAPPAPPAPAPAPAPAPPAVSKAAGLKGNPGQYFGADNYPPSAIRAEEEGRVVAKLTVGTDVRVMDCVVTTSSNSAALDQATCRIAKSRVRFSPAIDAAGNPTASSYTLPVRWVLPRD